MSAFVYILRCADGSYYVGSARGETLDKRMGEHQSGEMGGYTASRLPVELVYAEHFEAITDAIAAERRIKGWSRAKKEALIAGDWDRVQRLAKRPTARANNTPQPPHAEVLREAKPRSTHKPGASFEAPLRGAPQDEGREA
jgi:putative endonuclease